jgi:hypothetical protein
MIGMHVVEVKHTDDAPAKPACAGRPMVCALGSEDNDTYALLPLCGDR